VIEQNDLLVRVPTGISGLDQILQGGLLRGGSYLIVGQPGAGKTMLCNQICFHHVANGGRALYVTVLAESHTRLLAHLRTLTFFDPEPVARTLQYLSGYSVVEQSGLRGLLELLRREVRAQDATLLVVDGLSTVETIAESEISFKRFISGLQASLDMLGCTTLLQAQPSRDERANTMYTMVDGVIWLWDHAIPPLAVREVEVQKFRGSDYLRGRHQFMIDNHGITIHPRTESVLLPLHAAGEIPPRLVSFGIERLDEMLNGGLSSGTTTVVLGPAGSGKTVLGSHFLAAGVANGEQSMYFGFYETPDRLMYKADQVGLNFSSAVEHGNLHIIWQPPTDTLLDVLAERLLSAVRQRGITRLFVDGLEGFRDASVYPERMPRFLAALTNELRALNVTSLFSTGLRELLEPRLIIPIEGAADVMDNIIALRYVEVRSQIHRLLSISKIRERAFDQTIHEFRITGSGINVAESFESAEAVLTDLSGTVTTSVSAGRTRKRTSKS
jgi:circadian clock protein KaiC